jgi:hypothetical protein
MSLTMMQMKEMAEKCLESVERARMYGELSVPAIVPFLRAAYDAGYQKGQDDLTAEIQAMIDKARGR